MWSVVAIACNVESTKKKTKIITYHIKEGKSNLKEISPVSVVEVTVEFVVGDGAIFLIYRKSYGGHNLDTGH